MCGAAGAVLVRAAVVLLAAAIAINIICVLHNASGWKASGVSLEVWAPWSDVDSIESVLILLLFFGSGFGTSQLVRRSVNWKGGSSSAAARTPRAAASGHSRRKNVRLLDGSMRCLEWLPEKHVFRKRARVARLCRGAHSSRQG